MSIKSLLRKEGIEVISELNIKQVKDIAADVASKLCLAFPEHSLSRKDLFDSLCMLKMYMASMPYDLSGAKYSYKNNSIYFNEKLNPDEMSNVAVHECIHYMQSVVNSHGQVSRMGLCNLSTGLGLNEATVQLMASEANLEKRSSEMYYGISINTVSPNYYPLECALVEQLAYFTGTYPLYHSTINSNDVFKNTFIAKSSISLYRTICKNIDNLLKLENSLNYSCYCLDNTSSTSKISSLYAEISSNKESITNLFFETQNLIIEQFFTAEFNLIKNLTDIRLFQQRLYKFKERIGTSEDYSFYNYFYVDMMEKLTKKQDYIENYGNITPFAPANSLALTSLETPSINLSLISTLFRKLKKLFQSKDRIISYWEQ